MKDERYLRRNKTRKRKREKAKQKTEQARGQDGRSTGRRK